MEVTLLRSATLKLSYGGLCLLIDPVFADKFSRPSFAGKSPNPLVDLPMSKEDIVAGLDAVLVSHCHSDHFDEAAWTYLDKDLPLFCQPQEATALRQLGFKDLRPLTGPVTFKGVSISPTPTQHGSGAVLAEMGEATGFLLRAPGEPTVYWPGDTVLFQGVLDVLAREEPDLLITHSAGAVWGEGVKILLDEGETLALARALPRAVIVAVHLDAYDHGTVTRASLRAAAQEAGIPPSRLLIPRDGERLTDRALRGQS